jgi:hypothetical protein
MHFPLLTAIVLIGFAPYRFSPGPTGAATYLGLLVVAVLWSVVFWWCFERHTDRVFHLLSRRITVASPTRVVVTASNPLGT